MKTYIFDIDGTIANTDHRVHHLHSSPKDWNSWHAKSQEDTPYWEIVDLIDMAMEKDIKIVLCTGRDEKCRPETEKWFAEHAIHYDILMMRPRGDRRDDTVVKYEMLEQLRDMGYNPVLVFDDRNRVVDMWRAAGLRCLQVQPGEY